MTSASVINFDKFEPSYAMANNTQGNPISNQDQETIVTIHALEGDIPKTGQTPVQQPAVANPTKCNRRVRFADYYGAVQVLQLEFSLKLEKATIREVGARHRCRGA